MVIRVTFTCKKDKKNVQVLVLGDIMLRFNPKESLMSFKPYQSYLTALANDTFSFNVVLTGNVNISRGR